jgi:hypothetical protein
MLNDIMVQYRDYRDFLEVTTDKEEKKQCKKDLKKFSRIGLEIIDVMEKYFAVADTVAEIKLELQK